MVKKYHIAAIISLTLLAAGIALYTQRTRLTTKFFAPTNSTLQVVEVTPEENDIEIITQNLNIPWSSVFLPDGDILVTQRTGTLKRIGQGGPQEHTIDGVYHFGEGGLLGIALHPNYEQNNYIYLYYTNLENNSVTNRVTRYTYTNEATLTNKQEIISNIPGARFHNAGKIAFGPDDYLYITTGDAQDTGLSQQLNSLAGKILRLDENGAVPNDNPFGTAVYSYGHRNPQGLTWDKQGRLWATEHGASGNDEINLIESGANYGWPTIQGDQTAQNMLGPVIYSGKNETWAPTGIATIEDDLFFVGLRGEAIYKATILPSGSLSTPTAYFKSEYGRIRDLVVNNGHLYITTSNTDGRGNPKENDDKIIKINLRVFD